MGKQKRIDIIIRDEDDRVKKIILLRYEGLLIMPKIGECLTIGENDGFDVKLHHLIVVGIEHIWFTDQLNNGFLSVGDNYIYCKYIKDTEEE